MSGNLHGSSSQNLISTTPSYLFPGTNPENEVAVPKDSHERTLWEEEVRLACPQSEFQILLFYTLRRKPCSSQYFTTAFVLVLIAVAVSKLVA